MGAPKAGTTWLAAALAAHPEVSLSPVKEPHFFAPPEGSAPDSGSVTDDNVWRELARRGTVHSGWIRDPLNYERLLRPPPGRVITGEATVAYLHAPTAAPAISRRFPDAHIIAILREPVARAISHLRMDAALGRVRGSAEEILRGELAAAARGEEAGSRYMSRSLYAAAVARYFEHFEAGRVLALRFDDVRSRPGQVLEAVAGFLGVSPSRFPREPIPPKNLGQDPRWPTLNRWLVDSGAKDLVRRVMPRRLLRAGKHLFYKVPEAQPLSEGLLRDLKQYFEDDIRETARLTGLDLSGWLGSAPK